MRRSRVRLTVAALLFVGWVGFLVYLAATTTRPVVLSRPQFLAADLYVIATLQRGPGKEDAPGPTATVRVVAWAPPGEKLKAGETITVHNLPLCGPAFGWEGPGDYILPLERARDGSVYRVAATPRSPGYYAPDPTTRLAPARIYPATPTARRELQDLTAEFHR
ncbi:MAG: hypothetical protein IT429_19370 [Gemmataceae bacterium]|nr:hypothetical protein [Gemmataceae bacterium]